MGVLWTIGGFIGLVFGLHCREGDSVVALNLKEKMLREFPYDGREVPYHLDELDECNSRSKRFVDPLNFDVILFLGRKFFLSNQNRFLPIRWGTRMTLD